MEKFIITQTVDGVTDSIITKAKRSLFRRNGIGIFPQFREINIKFYKKKGGISAEYSAKKEGVEVVFHTENCLNLNFSSHYFDHESIIEIVTKRGNIFDLHYSFDIKNYKVINLEYTNCDGRIIEKYISEENKELVMKAIEKDYRHELTEYDDFVDYWH